MFQTGEFGYAEVDGVHVLEMPYVGGDLSMLVLLPATQDGLPALEQRLTADALAGYAAAVRTQEVGVALPRFRSDPPEPMALTEILPQLGMSLPFSPAADFSGMADIRPLYIQDVFHKAFVEVNEEGTEAAAATAVVMRTESAAMNPSFTADHPFLFVIRDRRSGFVLFMGRVADPSA